MSTSKIIVLKSSDGETFEVEEAVARQSQTLAHMIEDDCVDDEIPLANVTSLILTKVIEYCKKHVPVLVVPDADANSSSSAQEELKSWDAEFLSDIDNDTLYHLILAANYLNVYGLLDIVCQRVADMIKGKTVDEIRSTFKIENDFSPEEEAKVRAENQWAFDDHSA